MELKTTYIIYLLIFIFCIILLQTAWVCDDAYITFRTIDNWVNGYGLRWNIQERVQSFTHPLWLFLLSPFYAVSGEIYFTSIIVSVLLSLAVVIILVKKLSPCLENSILAMFILIMSKAFVDFSTSGLENPLTHFLIIIFLFLYLQKENTIRNLLVLSIITSLAAINRMDTVIILLPAVLYNVYWIKNFKSLWIIILGFIPFFLWEAFSITYYGFLFPNTAYAKLNISIPGKEIAIQGFKYLIDCSLRNTLTFIVIIIGTVLPFISNQKKLIPLSIGIISYLIYVVKIGGDFMSGRFFTAIFLIALISIVHKNIFLTKSVLNYIPIIFVLGLFPLCLKAIYGSDNYIQKVNVMVFGEKNENKKINLNGNGIIDEWSFYYTKPVYINFIKSEGIPLYFSINGINARNNNTKVLVEKNIGFTGFYAGPGVFIIDRFALADPLLSRLPAKIPWRIGHFERKIPTGYPETILSGINRIENENFALFYSKLKIITQGELFSRTRIKEIINFNLGKYNYLIDYNRRTGFN